MKTIESIDTPFDQTITLENQPSSNIEKLAGITVAVGVLNACAESSPPINKPVDDKILEECACMGGTPPPGAGPGAGVTPTPPATVALPAYVGSRRFRSVIGPSLTLATTMGMTTQTLSDGRNLPVWAFSDTALNSGFNGNRSIPGPTLEINQGQLANFTLSSAMPHTIHWHGLDVDQANDGVPSTSGFVAQAIPPMGNFGRLDPAWVLLGPQYTYSFTAPHAGTYMYHCHVDTVLHMEMGMSGTVIVRPADGNENVLWLAGPSFDVEYVWQLHTVDSRWHSSSPMAASGANTVRHRPNYFLINGKDGSDLLSDDSVVVSAAANQQVLIRLVNLGYQPANFSLGGTSFTIHASDGRPLTNAVSTDVLLIGPGERYDIIFTMPTLTAAANVSIDYLSIRGDVVLGSAVTELRNI